MCPHEEKLTAWLLGDLSPEEQQAMTRHMDGCDSCRAVSEELLRVLKPLRSGLAKDRSLHVEPKAGSLARRRNRWAWLWFRPHEGLKRAAILTVSIGSLFALISAVYQASQRETVSADTVTSIEFKKGADGIPAPALKPLAEAVPTETASDRLDTDTRDRNEALSAASRTVPYPKPPAAEPTPPKLRRLATGQTACPKKSEAEADASPAAATLPAAAEPTAPTSQTVSRQRSRAKAAPIERPPSDLMVKAMSLAGASLAPTNAVSTNTVPSPAVTPIAKDKP
jgi:hypothetical protein